MLGYVSKTDLEREIKAGSLADQYVLFGGEFFVLQGCVDIIVDAVVDEDFRSLNFSEFDGENIESVFEGLSSCLSTVAFSFGRRVALIKNLSYFKLSKSNLKKLECLIFESKHDSICIVTISTEDLNYGEIKRLKSWFDGLPKTAKIVDCSVKSNRELFNFFACKVENWGSKINYSNFNFLVSRLQTNWHAVSSELEKLSFYAFGREILRDDIINMTAPNLSFTAFELAEAVLNLNTQKALEILNNLVNSGFNLLLICGAINSSFIDIYRVKVCENISNSEIARVFNYKNCGFRLDKAKKMSRNFSLKQIRSYVSILSKLDLSLKTISADKKLLIERAIVEMTSSEGV